MDTIFCHLTDAGFADPASLPFAAVHPDGRSFTALEEQFLLGHLTLELLAELGFYPADVTDTPIDPATQVSRGYSKSLDEDTGRVHCVLKVRNLTEEELAEREKAANPVPQSVTSAQACVTLFDVKTPDGSTLLDKVDEAMASLPRFVQIWYNRAQDWYRDNAYVTALGYELNLDEEALDDLFRKASRRLL